MTKLPFPKGVLAQHTLILGKTRSGKSSTMRVMVEELLDKKKPVCIIDPKGDWWGIKSSANGKKAGYDLVIFGGTHADVKINAQSGKAVAELVATGNRPALIDLGGWMVGERTRFFIDFASTLFTKTHGHRWLCIDECHNFAPQQKIQDPQAGMSLHWANRLASEGAGKGIVLISASQRPQKVHKDYVTSHETLIAKRVVHNLDRDAFKAWIDGCGDPKQGKQVLDSLAGLQKPQAWAWSPEIDFGPKLVTFPMFKTYDSFAVQTGKSGRRLKGWASVDLDEVNAKLAAVAEEAKANDPKELRAEVAKLKAIVAAFEKKAATPLPPVQPAAPVKPGKDLIAAAEKRGFDQAERKLKRSMERAANTQIIGHLEGMQTVISPIAAGLKAAIDAAKKHKIELDKPVYVATAAPPTQQNSSSVQRMAAKGLPRSVPSGMPKTPSVAKPITPTGDGKLTGPQLKLLRALAWWKGMGHDEPTRPQVSAIAGWTVKSSNLRDRLGELSAFGLVEYPSSGVVRLTAAGIAAAPEPDLSTTLQDSIRRILTGPQLKVFESILHLTEVQQVPVDRTTLSAEVGWEPTSSNLRDRLGELNSLELIQYPSSGMVEFQPWVIA